MHEVALTDRISVCCYPVAPSVPSVPSTWFWRSANFTLMGSTGFLLGFPYTYQRQKLEWRGPKTKPEKLDPSQTERDQFGVPQPNCTVFAVFDAATLEPVVRSYILHSLVKHSIHHLRPAPPSQHSRTTQIFQHLLVSFLY